MRTRTSIAVSTFAGTLLVFSMVGLASAENMSPEVECDAIKSRSASIRLESDLTSSAPGALVGIRASVDTHSKPIYKGALWVRVTRPESGEIVGEFIAAKEIDSRGEVFPVSFEWRVPLLGGGPYEFHPVLVTSREPFLALPTSEEGSLLSLDVTGETSSVTHIDRTTLRIGGQQFPEGDIYSAPDSTPLVFDVAVRNDSDTPYNGRILWRTFKGGVSPDNEAFEVKEIEIKLHPHRETISTYEVGPRSGTVYVQGELTDGRSRSLIGIAVSNQATCEAGSDGVLVSPLFFIFGLGILSVLAGAWLFIRTSSAPAAL